MAAGHRVLGVALLALPALAAQAQCRPGDFLIGEDEKHYYCSHRSCGELQAQLERDRAAVERVRRNIDLADAELAEWTQTNSKAAADAAKLAFNTLHDAALGKLGELSSARLKKVREAFARRSAYGERWSRLLEKAAALESQSARLNATVDGLALGQYPASDLENAYLDIRGWAAKAAKQADTVDRLLREMAKDPEGAQVLKENGLALVSDGLKLALAPALAGELSLGEFFVNYGYDAYAWQKSRERILEETGNEETNRIAMCKVSAQYRRTVIEAGVCQGRYPAGDSPMPDPRKCR